MPVDTYLAKLFDGAIEVELPANFMDASLIRQVPDTQEVYLDSDGFTSVIFDILERVEGFPTDKEAAKYILEDVVDGGDTIRVWSSGPQPFTKLSADIPSIITFGTIHPGSPVVSPKKPKSGEDKAVSDFTGIVMMVVRLADQKTELAITVNVPHVPGEYNTSEIKMEEGTAGPLLNRAVEIRDTIMRTLEIKDWNLFKEEEAEE